MTPGARPIIIEEEIATGKVTCRRCGAVAGLVGTSKTYTPPYCQNCRKPEELRQDLGCDGACTREAPLCLMAPSGFKCPRGIFS